MPLNSIPLIVNLSSLFVLFPSLLRYVTVIVVAVTFIDAAVISPVPLNETDPVPGLNSKFVGAVMIRV